MNKFDPGESPRTYQLYCDEVNNPNIDEFGLGLRAEKTQVEACESVLDGVRVALVRKNKVEPFKVVIGESKTGVSTKFLLNGVLTEQGRSLVDRIDGIVRDWAERCRGPISTIVGKGIGGLAAHHILGDNSNVMRISFDSPIAPSGEHHIALITEGRGKKNHIQCGKYAPTNWSALEHKGSLHFLEKGSILTDKDLRIFDEIERRGLWQSDVTWFYKGNDHRCAYRLVQQRVSPNKALDLTNKQHRALLCEALKYKREEVPLNEASEMIYLRANEMKLRPKIEVLRKTGQFLEEVKAEIASWDWEKIGTKFKETCEVIGDVAVKWTEIDASDQTLRAEREHLRDSFEALQKQFEFNLSLNEVLQKGMVKKEIEERLRREISSATFTSKVIPNLFQLEENLNQYLDMSGRYDELLQKRKELGSSLKHHLDQVREMNEASEALFLDVHSKLSNIQKTLNHVQKTVAILDVANQLNPEPISRTVVNIGTGISNRLLPLAQGRNQRKIDAFSSLFGRSKSSFQTSLNNFSSIISANLGAIESWDDQRLQHLMTPFTDSMIMEPLKQIEECEKSLAELQKRKEDYKEAQSNSDLSSGDLEKIAKERDRNAEGHLKRAKKAETGSSDYIKYFGKYLRDKASSAEARTLKAQHDLASTISEEQISTHDSLIKAAKKNLDKQKRLWDINDSLHQYATKKRGNLTKEQSERLQATDNLFSIIKYEEQKAVAGMKGCLEAARGLLKELEHWGFSERNADVLILGETLLDLTKQYQIASNFFENVVPTFEGNYALHWGTFTNGMESVIQIPMLGLKSIRFLGELGGFWEKEKSEALRYYESLSKGLQTIDEAMTRHATALQKMSVKGFQSLSRGINQGFTQVHQTLDGISNDLNGMRQSLNQEWEAVTCQADSHHQEVMEKLDKVELGKHQSRVDRRVGQIDIKARIKDLEKFASSLQSLLKSLSQGSLNGYLEDGEPILSELDLVLRDPESLTGLVGSLIQFPDWKKLPNAKLLHILTEHFMKRVDQISLTGELDQNGKEEMIRLGTDLLKAYNRLGQFYLFVNEAALSMTRVRHGFLEDIARIEDAAQGEIREERKRQLPAAAHATRELMNLMQGCYFVGWTRYEHFMSGGRYRTSEKRLPIPFRYENEGKLINYLFQNYAKELHQEVVAYSEYMEKVLSDEPLPNEHRYYNVFNSTTPILPNQQGQIIHAESNALLDHLYEPYKSTETLIRFTKAGKISMQYDFSLNTQTNQYDLVYEWVFHTPSQGESLQFLRGALFSIPRSFVDSCAKWELVDGKTIRRDTNLNEFLIQIYSARMDSLYGIPGKNTHYDETLGRVVIQEYQFPGLRKIHDTLPGYTFNFSNLENYDACSANDLANRLENPDSDIASEWVVPCPSLQKGKDYDTIMRLVHSAEEKSKKKWKAFQNYSKGYKGFQAYCKAVSSLNVREIQDLMKDHLGVLHPKELSTPFQLLKIFRSPKDGSVSDVPQENLQAAIALLQKNQSAVLKQHEKEMLRVEGAIASLNFIDPTMILPKDKVFELVLGEFHVLRVQIQSEIVEVKKMLEEGQKEHLEYLKDVLLQMETLIQSLEENRGINEENLSLCNRLAALLPNIDLLNQLRNWSDG